MVRPSIFLISPCKEVTVATCCFWDGMNWEWTLDWSHLLRPHDTLELQFFHLLSQVSLCLRDSDSFIWGSL